MKLVHTIEVSGHSDEGPATWGQTAIRRALIARQPHDYQFNQHWGGPLEPPLPLADVLHTIRDFVESHDTLRTLIIPHGGGFVQRLVSSGVVSVVEAIVDSNEEIDRAAEEIKDELWGASFAPAVELPIRFGLVTRSGMVQHFIMVVGHTAVDRTGLTVLDADLVARVEGRRHTSGESWSPMDEAAWQHSDDGRRHDAATRARVLRTRQAAPTTNFLPRTGSHAEDDNCPPRYRQLTFRGEGLGIAAARAGKQLGVSDAVVLLAATSQALARAAGREDLVLQVMVSNRFLPPLVRSAVMTSMEGLLYVDGLTSDFSAVISRVWKASLIAYRSAYYDKDQLDANAAEYADADFDQTCWYNDRRGHRTYPRRMNSLSTHRFTWGDAPAGQAGTTIAIDIDDVPDASGDIRLTVLVDTRIVTERTVESLMTHLERTVLWAAGFGSKTTPNGKPSTDNSC